MTQFLPFFTMFNSFQINPVKIKPNFDDDDKAFRLDR